MPWVAARLIYEGRRYIGAVKDDRVEAPAAAGIKKGSEIIIAGARRIVSARPVIAGDRAQFPTTPAPAAPEKSEQEDPPQDGEQAPQRSRARRRRPPAKI